LTQFGNMIYESSSEWHERKWQLLLARRQNIAPPRNTKKGQRVIGCCKYRAIMFATSYFIVCRTHCSVRLICDKLSGRQLASKPGRYQLDKDESDAMEGKTLFNSAYNRLKFTLLDRDGRDVISSICNL
jgi:hypothetical protein